LIVEVLDRAGRVRERARVDSFPFVIGRSYSCGLILDDRFVSPEHLRLERDPDGALWAEDLASTNGTFDARTNTRSARVVIEPDTRLRAGSTVLRFRSTDYPVEPAAPRDAAPWLFEPFVRSNLRCISTFAGAVVLLVTAEYLVSFERFQVGDLLVALAFCLATLVSWAAAWALATRFLSPHFHFAPHCAIAAIALLVATAFSTIAELAAFALAADLSYRIFWWMGTAVVLAVILYGHLRLCSAAPARSLATGAVFSSAVIVGLCLLASVGFRWRDHGSVGGLDYAAQLKPPVFKLVRSREVAEFFDRAKRIKLRADEMASEGGGSTGEGQGDDADLPLRQAP
jgi:FHA domain